MRRTILCIDSNRALLLEKKAALERAGYSVTVAPNEELGLQALRTQWVDCVVLPGEDGGHLAVELKQVYPSMPVVLHPCPLEPEPEVEWMMCACLPDEATPQDITATIQGVFAAD